jgi:hypothetical protein
MEKPWRKQAIIRMAASKDPDVMLELISIHIAKTGGQSLYAILKNEYGDALDPRTRRTEYFPDKDYSQPLADRIPGHIKVIHGHLHYIHVEEIHRKYKPRIITWFRNPVDRVISNYYYMIARSKQDGEKYPQYSKRNHSLVEYARDSIPNKMSKYLRGIDPEEFFFIGFQEHFKDDIKTLSAMLNWSHEIPDIKYNTAESTDAWAIAPTRKDDITADMREEIELLNKADMELYERVKSLRLRS